MQGKYVSIKLTPDQRLELEKFSAKGVHSVKIVNRAKIILALDESKEPKKETQTQIAKRLYTSYQTIAITKKDFLNTPNISDFLKRKKRTTPPTPPKITGETEARIIALACTKPPKGYAKWTLRLLANKSIELDYINTISHTSVSKLLKKQNLSLT
jgi:transposase